MPNTTTRTFNEVAKQTRSSQDNHTHAPPDDPSDAVKSFAHAIADAIHKLGISAESIALGESLLAIAMTAMPLRRSAEKEPGLTVAGLTAMATGAALLGLAVVRSRQPGSNTRTR